MPQDPDPSFFTTFGPELDGPIRAALTRAYETASEFHDPDRGSNEVTFGFNLYHYAVHELEREIGRLNGKLGRIPAGGSFRIGAGEWQFGCYRVGRSESERIETSFPRNDGAAADLVQEAWLPGLEPDVSKARTAVLAHFGNPDDGLCALYWAIPTRVENDKITEWGYAKLIWAHEVPIVQSGHSDLSHPEDEVVEDQPLRRRRRSNPETLRPS